MRLMADLISYLRDLLVFKVKPEALSEDVDPELQKSLAAQAELIETDRLLELIDQFAEAEGRMKWAPNKKLHFEVALIKAIQSLNQVTLNEVIENLNALRDGKKTVAAGAMAGSGKHRDPSDADAASSAQASAVGDRSYSNVDAEKLWKQLCAKIPSRGFLRTIVDSLAVVGVDGRTFILAYPAEEKSSIETLASPSNRKQLQDLLNQISGRDWTLKLTAKEGLLHKRASAVVDDYKHDPLIREALEVFKGEIKD
jgi:DNA polymerase III gamma/tau subunit